MHKLALLSLVIWFLSGCASATMVPFTVDSTPQGGQIDVNGVTLGTTPMEIQLQCSKRWVGVAVAPGGWAYDNAIYDVTVYPSRNNPGVSQTKRVNACQVKNPPGHLFFDLALDPVSPRQRIDLDVNRKPNGSSLEETLLSLKRLRDQGFLTEQEYHEKVDKALKELGR
ncbi:MAG: SHOCT domain-containing protein [Nitrospirota bacterium]